MNEERIRWQNECRGYKGKTIDFIEVTDSWTSIVFKDGSILGLRDNPQFELLCTAEKGIYEQKCPTCGISVKLAT